MRPIDADAMYKRYCVDASGLDGIYDTTDLPDMLAEMPTIDAIPVEWLNKRKTEYLNDWGENPVTVEQALKMWQKEQEVRT